MRYLATIENAVRAVCKLEPHYHHVTDVVTVEIGGYLIHINDTPHGPTDINILVHKLGTTQFPTKAFECNLGGIREQLTLAYHGCLLEAFE